MALAFVFWSPITGFSCPSAPFAVRLLSLDAWGVLYVYVFSLEHLPHTVKRNAVEAA